MTGIESRDQAIEEADQALKLPREKRVENFAQMLKEILDNAAAKGKVSERWNRSSHGKARLQRTILVKSGNRSRRQRVHRYVDRSRCPDKPFSHSEKRPHRPRQRINQRIASQ